MGKTFEKYIPSNETELKTTLESYDITEIEKKQKEIKETT
jgi:hypothetical protein